MNPVYKPNKSAQKNISAAIPDPWFMAAQSAEPLIPSWQFPLDPDHELSGQPAPESIPGAGPVGAGLLPERKYPEVDAVNFLIEEELRLPVIPGDHLRDEIRDAIAYLELAETKAS